MEANTDGSLIRVENLSVGFTSEGKTVPITENVSFEIHPGEIYGLVGESGCGKTVTCLSLLRLLPQPAGKILTGSIEFKGRNLLELELEEMRKIRGREISMIFQEPAVALNPVLNIQRQLLECFEFHSFDRAKINPEARIDEVLKQVGFPDPGRILRAHPHELSGGMLQRVMIAMALLLKPDVLIADEPTTALDVTVQAQIMDLLKELQKEAGTAILMITHNMGLIAQYADRLGVMYAGRLVEESQTEKFLAGPLHPYSKGLLAAIPDLALDKPDLTPIPGQVPLPREFVNGCRFKERCEQAFEPCDNRPILKNSQSENRKVSCFLYD